MPTKGSIHQILRFAPSRWRPSLPWAEVSEARAGIQVINMVITMLKARYGSIFIRLDAGLKDILLDITMPIIYDNLNLKNGRRMMPTTVEVGVRPGKQPLGRVNSGGIRT
jgi:hypothetical protein